MNLRHQLLSAAVLLSVFGLASCASWKERPQENPHPQYYLTLKGHIAKSLRNEVRLRFIQTVAALSDKCTHVTNHLEGVTGNPTKSHTYVAEPDAKGNYEIKVPLDKYLPGYCDWQPWAMGITLTDQEYYYDSNGLAFITYSNTESKAHNAYISNYYCSNPVDNSDTGDNCYSIVKPGNEVPTYLRTNMSTDMTVNVSLKEKKYADHP